MPTRLNLRLAAVVLLVAGTAACSQESPAWSPEQGGLPETDIYLAGLAQVREGLRLGAPRNVIRRPGYDNQPVFLPDGNAFLFTVYADDQADTYRYEIPGARIIRVTATPAGEWAPALTPDGLGFTISRAELEGFQRLWRFPMDGRSPRVVLRDITGAGYHTWVDEHTVALFVSGEPPLLRLVDSRSEEGRTVATHIGRCLQTVPGTRTLAFVDKTDPGDWRIRYLDLDTMEDIGSIPARRGNEDFAILRDGSILMGEGPRMFRHRPDSTEWDLVADWSDMLEGEITRIAVSPLGNRIAFVVRTS